MILIKNTQRKIKIDEKKIKKDILKMLRSLSYQNFDIGIWFTTNQTICKYNKKYRKINKSTDILSFPYHTNLKPGQKIKVISPEDKNLGDIIISLEYVKKNMAKSKTTFYSQIKKLLAHGIAHLLGYTHKTNIMYKKMIEIEKKLLKVLND